MDTTKFPKVILHQHQDQQPGLTAPMQPQPIHEDPDYQSANKLEGKVAIISGGDSGIGRAVAIAFALEGADIAITYLNEHEDAQTTKEIVEKKGRRCLVIAGDIGNETLCQDVIKQTVEHLGKVDILINNAAEQHPQDSLLDITAEQMERTFRTNIFSAFYLTKAALAYMKEGSTIINTVSITAYAGHKTLIDYSATKGALVTFTRSLSLSLANKGIRVNGVAPGPIWTPLIPASFNEDHVSTFGSKQPMGRPGQPVELAPAYVYLASDDSSYVSGQIIHVNGGEIVNG